MVYNIHNNIYNIMYIHHRSPGATTTTTTVAVVVIVVVVVAASARFLHALRALFNSYNFELEGKNYTHTHIHANSPRLPVNVVKFSVYRCTCRHECTW